MAEDEEGGLGLVKEPAGIVLNQVVVYQKGLAQDGILDAGVDGLMDK